MKIELQSRFFMVSQSIIYVNKINNKIIDNLYENGCGDGRNNYMMFVNYQ